MDIVRSLHRKLCPGSWDEQRLNALLSPPWSDERYAQARLLCGRAGWPCTEIREDLVSVILVRTPDSLVFRVKPPPREFRLYAGYHAAALGFPFLSSAVRPPGWEHVLGNRAYGPLWDTVVEGCTPLLDTSTSMHQALEQRRAMEAQNDIPGWSGQAVLLPRELSMGPDLLLALRHGGCVVFLTTPCDGMAALYASGPGVPLPPLRAVGVYLGDGS